MELSDLVPNCLEGKKKPEKKRRTKIRARIAIALRKARDAQGAEPEKPPINNNPSNNPIFQEIADLDIDQLRRVLDAGASLTKLNRERQTPLRFALHLIERGRIPNLKYNVAVNIVELLLQRGADPNNLDEQGKSPLHGVILYWNRFIKHAKASDTAEKLAQLLVTHGAHVNYKGNKPSLDPFRVALKKHNTRAIEFFIKNGYKLGEWRCKLPGPTIWPPVLGYDLFVKLVKENVYDIEAPDWCGLTALHRALQMVDGYGSGLVGVIHLLDVGANVNALDCAGRSVLLKATRMHHLPQDAYSDLVRLITLRGANVVRDCQMYDWAPIRSVLQFGDWDAVSLLLDMASHFGLKLEKLCKHKPFHLVMKNPCDTVLEQILKSGLFRLEQKNEVGDTPLQSALICPEMFDSNLATRVELLLLWGARSNSINNNGWTPLHAACSSALYECTKMLLRHGADVNIRTQQNELPLHMALRCGDIRIPELLICHISLRESVRDLIDLEHFHLIKNSPKLRKFHVLCQGEIEWAKSTQLYSWVSFYHLLTQDGLSRSVPNEAMLNSLLDEKWRNSFLIYDYLIDDRLKLLKFIQTAAAYNNSQDVE